MRYFDKAFFKFTLGFLCIISISLFIVVLAANFKDDNFQVARPAFTE
jgi:hypothetical protein